MLTNKNIVVTGANRGIGKMILQKCAENHANIWALTRHIDDEMLGFWKTLENQYHVWITPVKIDMQNEDSVISSAKEILTRKEAIWGIVNNAGITGENRLFAMTSQDELRKVFQTNFFSPMLLTQKLLRNMIKNRKGSIVNISSVAALDGEPAQFAYVTSKASLVGATKKLSSELAAIGIRVNAVAPGMTNTGMIEQMQEELKQKSLENIPMKRLARPEEIADTVVFLLSEKSSFITGQVIRVDGGKI